MNALLSLVAPLSWRRGRHGRIARTIARVRGRVCAPSHIPRGGSPTSSALHPSSPGRGTPGNAAEPLKDGRHYLEATFEAFAPGGDAQVGPDGIAHPGTGARPPYARPEPRYAQTVQSPTDGSPRAARWPSRTAPREKGRDFLPTGCENEGVRSALTPDGSGARHRRITPEGE